MLQRFGALRYCELTFDADATNEVEHVSLSELANDHFFYPLFLIREHRSAWGLGMRYGMSGRISTKIENVLKLIPSLFRSGSSFSVELTFGLCIPLQNLSSGSCIRLRAFPTYESRTFPSSVPTDDLTADEVGTMFFNLPNITAALTWTLKHLAPRAGSIKDGVFTPLGQCRKLRTVRALPFTGKAITFLQSKWAGRKDFDYIVRSNYFGGPAWRLLNMPSPAPDSEVLILDL